MKGCAAAGLLTKREKVPAGVLAERVSHRTAVEVKTQDHGGINRVQKGEAMDHRESDGPKPPPARMGVEPENRTRARALLEVQAGPPQAAEALAEAVNRIRTTLGGLAVILPVSRHAMKPSEPNLRPATRGLPVRE